MEFDVLNKLCSTSIITMHRHSHKKCEPSHREPNQGKNIKSHCYKSYQPIINAISGLANDNERLWLYHIDNNLRPACILDLHGCRSG